MNYRTLLHLLLLTALSWATYLPGLTSHGLTNWQEAQRALVAREMQARRDWIVPTVDGRPYLAKPPMIYWWQLAIASVRGQQTGELELRLTVALAGWLGVLATYLAARRILAGAGPPDATADTAALWSAAFLTTGLLYVRSARIGELDILLVPFTVAAIGAIHTAWRSHLDRARTHFPAVALAILAAIGAMLTKGPPALLAIGIAGYGGIALWEAAKAGPRTRRDVICASAGGLSLAAAAGALSPAKLPTADGLIGLLLFAAIGAALGTLAGRLARPAAAVACFRAYARTHPIAVLGLPFLALWIWGRLVTARVGAAAVDAAARVEAADNLRPLVLESPLNNLEAAVYGVGLGSIAAIAAAVLWLRRRERPAASPGTAVMVAWVVGGLVAFSLLGKGVPRYLTPVWPGIAILGGWGMARLLAAAPRPKRLTRLALAAVLGLAIGQSWWYGLERERRFADRSPRAMIAELQATPGFDPAHFAMFEFEHPAVDFYAGRSIESLADTEPRPGLVGLGPRTIADLHAQLRSEGGSSILLIRRTQSGKDQDLQSARSRLLAAGFAVEDIPLRSRFTVDNRRTDIDAVCVIPVTPAGTASPAPGS